MKTTLYKIHKWVGLSVGVLLLMQAITGLILAHKDGLLALFGPKIDAQAPHQPLDSIIGLLQKQYPGERIERIVYYQNKELPLIARVYPPDSTIYKAVVIDPTRAEILSDQPFWRRPLQLAERLHVSLHLGEPGHNILLVEATALIFLGISGLIVWWPRHNKFAKALVIHWKGQRLRLLRDLHAVPGAVTAVLMLLAGLTGGAIILDEALKAAVAVVAPVAPDPDRRLPEVAVAAPQITWQQALEQLKTRFPDGRIRQLRLMAGERVLATIMVAENAVNPRAHHIASVDRWADQLSVIADGNALLSGDAALEWMLPLHTGEAYGPLRPLLMTILGLSLSGMGITGIWMWAKKRPRKIKSAAPAE